ncbi:hypothetical protein NHX12_005542 [Muraenolepis orangiensis]|uniref:Uncharacterized protein n=1 Tax=Muraenolepis orangiensis TaxID=630683 RepID=A0A9Q0DT39_9TELE|nr:hypothetical protein NHX12_005542 [Muraenolepis orangiensis]
MAAPVFLAPDAGGLHPAERKPWQAGHVEQVKRNVLKNTNMSQKAASLAKHLLPVNQILDQGEAYHQGLLEEGGPSINRIHHTLGPSRVDADTIRG